MNDLRTLFGPDTDFDGKPQPTDEPSELKAMLRTLVGATSRPSESPNGGGFANLGNLKALVGSSDAGNRDSVLTDLSSVFGAERTEARSSTKLDLPPLVRSGAVAVEGAGWQAPELAQVGQRPLFGGRRRAGAVNYLSIFAAVIAVVALVGTASFAVVQRVTANPADDAMVSLREREAELANETKTLQTASDLFDASVKEATDLGQSSEPVLLALQGRVNAAPLATAEAARSNLLRAAASAGSVVVPKYERAAIDEKDLADVGKAIDGVRLARESLPSLLSEAREARSEVTTAVSSFRAELVNLGSAIEAEANEIASANAAAAQTFRSAVTDAAARVRASQQAGGDGLSEMPLYAAAVDALRAENQRVLVAEEAEREATPSEPRSPGAGSNNGGGTDTGGSPDSGSTPSPEPSQPSPAPEPDPEPEPEPTETDTPGPGPAPSPDPTLTIPGAGE